jgi:hypothetical protein
LTLCKWIASIISLQLNVFDVLLWSSIFDVPTPSAEREDGGEREGERRAKHFIDA